MDSKGKHDNNGFQYNDHKKKRKDANYTWKLLEIIAIARTLFVSELEQSNCWSNISEHWLKFDFIDKSDV